MLFNSLVESSICKQMHVREQAIKQQMSNLRYFLGKIRAKIQNTPLLKFKIPGKNSFINPNWEKLLKKCKTIRAQQAIIQDLKRGKPTKTNNNMNETTNEHILPPECVRGMKKLDRNMFRTFVYIPSIYIEKDYLLLLKKPQFKQFLLKMPKIKAVLDISEEKEQSKTHKAILLKPTSCEDGALKQSVLDNLTDLGYSGKPMVEFSNIELQYENWNYNEILKAILPKESDGIGGYSTVGHIIHLNLRDEVTDYKHVIGEVLLDKIRQAKTVVNKLNIIDNTFRNFQMEVIAGEPNFITEVKERGVKYKMDFSKVYWNPRLETEHSRVVEAVRKGDVIFDMFAGIGPFAIPAAKKGGNVFANDLNPESYKWMNENIKINRVKTVESFNMDGREFMTTIAKKELVQRMKERYKDEPPKLHIVMNLPALAIEFTDVFPGLFSDVDKSELKNILLPIVYCYCFSRGPDLEQDVRQRIESVMKWSLPDNCEVRNVRNVAPGKDMMCATYQLTEELLFNNVHVDNADEISGVTEPPAKKQKEMV